jgi:CubicO group peptidase (beta-lactamase class C family)
MTLARIVLTAAFLLGAASPGFAQQPLPDSTRLAINRVFASWSTSDGPGCALGVSRNAAMVYQNGYGMANLESDAPITAGSIFHVASVSKQFTSMAILLLAEDGKLSLDDEVRKYLPELPDYGQRITLRHLLTHTSGLRDQWDLLSLARGRFEEDRITEADVLEIVARQKALNFVPGTEYLYSNTGYTLLGTIVRRVSGKSLRAFADERIFKPLGMQHTHFHDDYTMVVKSRAAGYNRTGGVWHVSLPNYDTYGATSLFSTVGDLLLWEANVAKPTVGNLNLFAAMEASAVLTNGDSTAYGLGRSVERYRGLRLVGHGGADAGYRTYLGQFPEHGLALAVLCNAAQANPSALARGVADVFLRDKLGPLDEPVKALARPTMAQLARIAGVYVNPVTGIPTFITLRDTNLVLGRVSGPELIPLTEQRFKVRGQPVEFEFGEGGLVQRFVGWPSRQNVRMKREEPAKPARAELDRYAGSYYSEELGTTYTVKATDSTLVLTTRWGSNERTVRPAYGDTFIGDFLLSFTRGRKGEVAGMLMSTGRTRGVRFVRNGAR